MVPTDLDPVRANVKDSHHTRDEGTDGLKVKASNTPGAIHQQHNIGLRFGLASHACEGKSLAGERDKSTRGETDL